MLGKNQTEVFPYFALAIVSKYLDIPIDHYAAINLKGIQDLVDAVGGVTVNNDLAFAVDGTSFDIGQIELNGEEALAFVRMRYDDPRGDYGRQERQRIVIQGIMQKWIYIFNKIKILN